MKMLIIRSFIIILFLLLLTGKAESGECLLKYGFGLSQDEPPIFADAQPSVTLDLDGCKTICDEDKAV